MQTKTNDLGVVWQITFLMMLSAVVVMLPDVAFAQMIISQTVNASQSPADEAICLALNWMTGNAGSAIGSLGIAILGVGASLGKITWGLAMTIGAGVALLFGATNVANSLGATGCNYQ